MRYYYNGLNINLESSYTFSIRSPPKKRYMVSNIKTLKIN